MKTKDEILSYLHEIARNRSTPFCYDCSMPADVERCQICGNIELMRWVDGLGCEYGTYWIVEHILDTEMLSVDQAFEMTVRHIYSDEISVGWMKFDLINVMKSQDLISWKEVRDRFVDTLQLGNMIFTIDDGANYYWLDDVEILARKGSCKYQSF